MNHWYCLTIIILQIILPIKARPMQVFTFCYFHIQGQETRPHKQNTTWLYFLWKSTTTSLMFSEICFHLNDCALLVIHWLCCKHDLSFMQYFWNYQFSDLLPHSYLIIFCFGLYHQPNINIDLQLMLPQAVL